MLTASISDNEHDPPGRPFRAGQAGVSDTLTVMTTPSPGLDEQPDATADEWLTPGPADRHPEGGFEPRTWLTPSEAAALERLTAAGAVGVMDVTAEPEAEI
jgi:hypothetical protein